MIDLYTVKQKGNNKFVRVYGVRTTSSFSFVGTGETTEFLIWNEDLNDFRWVPAEWYYPIEE